MTRVSIIVPTVRGRGDAFRAVLDAWHAEAAAAEVDAEYVAPRDYPTVGEAWSAGANLTTSDVLVFAIDDAIPHQGALSAGLDAVARGVIPSPRLLFADGTLEACGTMGGGQLMPECATGTPCRAAGILAVSRSAWGAVGPFLPIHYYSDDEWCWRALNVLGLRCEVVRDWRFTHGHHPVRRAAVQARAQEDARAFAAAAAQNLAATMRAGGGAA